MAAAKEASESKVQCSFVKVNPEFNRGVLGEAALIAPFPIYFTNDEAVSTKSFYHVYLSMYKKAVHVYLCESAWSTVMENFSNNCALEASTPQN